MGQSDADLDHIEDTTLMVMFANGQPAAARALTARLLPRVLGHAARVLGNRSDAEDVAQEAMLRLWKAAANWTTDGGARPSTWLYRVTANLCVDRLRRGGRAVGLDTIAEPEDNTPSVEAQMIQSDRMTALDHALAQLPERQRQAVVLRHIEGLANPEIADVLEISVDAVESLTARARRNLAKILDGQQEALGYGTE